MKYTITFYSYWRIGTGLGGGSKDNILMKDDDKLPVIPGKTLKGLIRDAYNELGLEKDNDKEVELFGQELADKPGAITKEDLHEGKLYFGSATLPEDEINYLKQNPDLIPVLYDTITTTRLDDDKQNEDSALVKSEVCIPLTLEAEILPKESGEIPEKDKENLIKALQILRLMGEKRYRGLGRCKIEVTNQENQKS